MSAVLLEAGVPLTVLRQVLKWRLQIDSPVFLFFCVLQFKLYYLFVRSLALVALSTLRLVSDSLVIISQLVHINGWLSYGLRRFGWNRL